MFNPEESVNGDWNTEFMGIAQDVLSQNGCLYILTGGRGCGKSQMAAALIRVAIENNILSYYRKTMDFFMAIKETYKTDATEREVIRDYQAPGLLVLDEIQVRGESEWENNLLTHLIDLRYDDKKSTVLIGNVPMDKVRAQIGDSIYSRMVETGGVINCDWKSFRSKGQA